MIRGQKDVEHSAGLLEHRTRWTLHAYRCVCVHYVGYRGMEGPVIQQVVAISRLSAPLSPVCRHTFTLASTGLYHITI